MAEDKQKDPNLPSWAGKSLDEMTPKEKEDYIEQTRKRFTWEEGDLVKVGHEPLTEDEKKLVEDIKKSREEEAKKE